MWQTVTRSVASDHHNSQEAAIGLGPASTGTQTRAEASRASTSADGCLTAPKNLYLKDGLPPDFCSFTPSFCQMVTVDEIGVKRLACFLDKRDLTMFEPLATPNNEQPAPS